MGERAGSAALFAPERRYCSRGRWRSEAAGLWTSSNVGFPVFPSDGPWSFVRCPAATLPRLLSDYVAWARLTGPRMRSRRTVRANTDGNGRPRPGTSRYRRHESGVLRSRPECPRPPRVTRFKVNDRRVDIYFPRVSGPSAIDSANRNPRHHSFSTLFRSL